MTDQTVILKIIPILSADGLSGMDSPGGGTKGGRTTETTNPTSKSNKGAGGSSVMGKFMAGVGFAPAAAGIAAAVTIIMQLMKDISWALKPVMSVVSAIAKMLGVFLVPVMQGLMMFLLPILQMLRPMVTMFRMMMKPFEEVIRRAQRLMGAAAAQGDVGAMGIAGNVGFMAMMLPFINIIRQAIETAFVEIIQIVWTLFGTLLQFIGDALGGPIGAALHQAGTDVIGTVTAVTDLMKSLIAIGEDEISKAQVGALNAILSDTESVLKNNIAGIGTTTSNEALTAQQKTDAALTTFMNSMANVFTNKDSGVSSFAPGLELAYETGILAPTVNFIKKLAKKADEINKINVNQSNNLSTFLHGAAHFVAPIPSALVDIYNRAHSSPNTGSPNTGTSSGGGGGSGAR